MWMIGCTGYADIGRIHSYSVLKTEKYLIFLIFGVECNVFMQPARGRHSSIVHKELLGFSIRVNTVLHFNCNRYEPPLIRNPWQQQQHRPRKCYQRCRQCVSQNPYLTAKISTLQIKVISDLFEYYNFCGCASECRSSCPRLELFHVAVMSCAALANFVLLL